MSLLAQGIAHVSFPGGGTFLPFRSAGDRRRLIANIANYSRTGDPVQLLFDEQRWVIRPRNVSLPTGCAGCGTAAELAAFSVADENTSYCITCVLAGDQHEALAETLTGLESVVAFRIAPIGD